MGMGQRTYRIVRAVVMVAMALPTPAVFAQLEVPEREVARFADVLSAEIDRTSDPAMKAELEKLGAECRQDLEQDAEIDNLETEKAAEAIVSVERARDEALGKVAAEQVANEVSKINPELGSQLKEMALGQPELGGGTGGGSGETMDRGKAKEMFEKAYEQAKSADPEGAERMKEMFESFEKGDFSEMMRSTPEMAERMRSEMESHMREFGENEYARDMAETAMREMDMGMSREDAQAEFEKWAASSGESPEKVADMRAMMDKMQNEGSSPERWSEGPMREMMDPREMPEQMRDIFEKDREIFEKEFADREKEFRERGDLPERERDFSSILDNRIEPQPGSGERIEMVVHAADHNNDGDTTDPGDMHPHEIHIHSDTTRHDHTQPGSGL